MKRWPAQEKIRILNRFLQGKERVNQVCKNEKISRKTFYSWLNQSSKAVGKHKRRVLTNNYRQGADHWQSLAKLTEKSVLATVIQNPDWGPRKIANYLRERQFKISIHGVQGVLKRNNLSQEAERQTLAGIYSTVGGIRTAYEPGKLRLLSIGRKQMVEAVVLGRKKVTDICREYKVSRKTYYKWFKRYLQGWNSQANLLAVLEDQYLKGRNHYRALSLEQEDRVLELVKQQPQWSVAGLTQQLTGIGHHGVQNVLQRNQLNTYELRLAYSQQEVRSVRAEQSAGRLDWIRSVWPKFIPSLAPAPPPNVIRAFGWSTLITVIVSLGLGYWFKILANFTSVSQAIGLVLASAALMMGMFFFIYSLKYYLTIAIVLSFSQREGEEEVDEIGKTKSYLTWLLGLMGSKAKFGYSGPVGLKPDLGKIKLHDYPKIAIHIPFYNEKRVVERSIEAALQINYPNFEIVLLDDSTDETPSLITKTQEKYLAKGKNIKITKGDGWVLKEAEVRSGLALKHLNRTTRSGYKGGALKLALELTDPEVKFVSVFDADFVPYPDTLELFLKYFKAQNEMKEDYSRSKVAAVQGYQWHVLNKSENWITRGIRNEYSGSYVIERAGAEIYGGLKQISGSVYMIRREVLEQVGWGTSITEDFELTLRLYAQGYKVVYTPYIQAPAECVSTLKRLIRQRMRWAEGHSQNIKKNFIKLLTNPQLSPAEKLEFAYLSPYYLQAGFFLVGTLAWLMSETVFPARLPFWTSLWGWSLVLTNMIALPLMNSVGLFLEDSEHKDYLGLASFIVLSYILVPFQAYAAVKGFMEKEEGPWFRTPKTGMITDVFTRGRFYRFIQGILPGGGSTGAVNPSPYLALATANGQFNNFQILRKRNRPVMMTVLALLLTISVILFSLAPGIAQNHIPVAWAAGVMDIDYETGNLTQCTGSDIDGGDLSVTTAAKLEGSYGLSVLIDDANQIRCYKDVTKSAIYRERFYIDPNTMTMANNNSFDFHHANQNGGGTGANIFSFDLKYLTASGYQLIAWGFNDAGGYPLIDNSNITDATHYVEIKAVRATNATSSDGSYQWWVDGVDQGAVTGVDNYNLMYDAPTYRSQWGMISGRDSGTSGTFYLDAFKANDDGSEIGAVPENLWVFLLVVPFIPSWFNRKRKII